ncbi:MAG: alkaline phosphatase family protein [Chloroflexi bacterium]|nr:alkaline phosphatase family protein [Chloroflexota bacterium]
MKRHKVIRRSAETGDRQDSGAARRRRLRNALSLPAALCLLLAGSFAGGAASPPARAATRAAPGLRAQYLVLMVLDGARPDYFGLVRLPHVDALRAEGVQYTYAIDGILESETPSGHATLSTGSTPRRDGILGFNWAVHQRDYSLFSPAVVRAGAMEWIMRNAHDPTIAGQYKNWHPHARVVAVSGHKYYASDPLGGPRADVIMYYQGNGRGQYAPVAIPGHVPPARVLMARGLVGSLTHPRFAQDDTLATKLALSAFAVLHQRITLINYAEFDWPLGHVDGGIESRKQVIRLMRAFDRDLGKIERAYRRAGVLRKTLFVITADHGMAPIRELIPFDVIHHAAALARTKVTAAATYTAAYVWLRNRGKAGVVAQNILAAHARGIQSVYFLQGPPGDYHYVLAGGDLLGPAVDAANQHLLATLMDGHEPAVVVFCREGASFARPSYHWRADHGGASWQAQHIPLILAGAGVRRGVVTGEPAQLDDVAPTVLTAMGVTPLGMEGQVLTEALRSSIPSAQGGRQAEAEQLTPLIRALVAQDRYELAYPG